MSPAAAKNAHVWDRGELDWYQEPIRATQALLSVERFVGVIWDPACGGGNIVKACLAAGHEAVGSDIVDRAGSPAWFRGEMDFLGGVAPASACNIITNPPFFRAKGTEAFIRHAIAVATSKVAIFADIKFLAGQARAKGLWADHPPTRVWVIPDRPSCPPGEWIAAGNVAGGGTADWCWLVWSLTEPATPTQLRWLPPLRSKLNPSEDQRDEVAA